jgi:hypothetical protein
MRRMPREAYGPDCRRALEGGSHLPGHLAPRVRPCERDRQQELLEAVCERFHAGEGVACRFFSMNNTYLFIGDHKYWLMEHWDELEPRATTSSTVPASTGTGEIS